jgi:glycosyltransferase involved in cell wall biosynthesis
MIRDKVADCKIVLFAVEAPPSISGSGINAYLLAKQLSIQTSQTTFCHLNYNNKFQTKTNDEKLIIRRFAYYNHNLITKSVSFLPLLLNYLQYVIKNDVIIVFSGYLIGYQFIILISSLLKKKVIFRSTLLNGDDATSLTKKSFLLKHLNKLTLKRLTFYYSINVEFTNRFLQETKNKIPVFESFQGVDINKFHPVKEDEKRKVRNSLRFKEDEIVILSVGNLLKRKAYHLIFPQLTKLNVNFKYIVAGEYKANSHHRITKEEKKEMAELFNLGQDLLGERVVFTGPIVNVQEYFYAADLFVHGSFREGTPNALLEAMACGIPSLVYKLPGISGFLTHHDINAIEFENHEDLFFLIQDTLANPTKMKHIGRNAAETISENYTFEKVAVNFLKKLYG